MICNKEKGFTLVELLAVIAVLGLILIIAIPKVMDVLNTQKKRTLELTAKSIIKAAEEKYVENASYGINEKITCEGISNITSNDFESCDISFDDSGNANVTIIGKGRYDGLGCQGSKESITCQKGPILLGLQCTFNGELVQGAEFIHNQYTYRYKEEYVVDPDTMMPSWETLAQDGWHVRLTDKTSTVAVNTPVCSYINGKPLLSTATMFVEQGEGGNILASQASEIDVSSWDTHNVVNMSGMFGSATASTIKGLNKLETNSVTNMMGMFMRTAATSLDLSNFDTNNVTNMMGMFQESAAISLDLSNFNTGNVTNMMGMFYQNNATSLDLSDWDTGNVITMNSMFSASTVTSLDLSSFDTTNVDDMNYMFYNSAATTGYARTQADADKFNNTSVTNIPDTLTFTVKISN